VLDEGGVGFFGHRRSPETTNPPRGRVREDGSDGQAGAPAGGLVDGEHVLVLDAAGPADFRHVVLAGARDAHGDLVGPAGPGAGGAGRHDVAAAVSGTGRWRGEVAVL